MNFNFFSRIVKYIYPMFNTQFLYQQEAHFILEEHIERYFKYHNIKDYIGKKKVFKKNQKKTTTRSYTQILVYVHLKMISSISWFLKEGIGPSSEFKTLLKSSLRTSTYITCNYNHKTTNKTHNQKENLMIYRLIYKHTLKISYSKVVLYFVRVIFHGPHPIIICLRSRRKEKVKSYYVDDEEITIISMSCRDCLVRYRMVSEDKKYAMFRVCKTLCRIHYKNMNLS